ncbi:MAG: hypothetical protein WB761_25410 [Solirubrobacteraceae bacterium]
MSPGWTVCSSTSLHSTTTALAGPEKSSGVPPWNFYSTRSSTRRHITTGKSSFSLSS